MITFGFVFPVCKRGGNKGGWHGSDVAYKYGMVTIGICFDFGGDIREP